MNRKDFIYKIHEACEEVEIANYTYSFIVIDYYLNRRTSINYGCLLKDKDSESYKSLEEIKQHRIISMLLFKEHCLQHKLYREF